MNRVNVHVDRCRPKHTLSSWAKYAVLGLNDAQFADFETKKEVLCLQDLCIFRARSSMRHNTREHQRDIDTLPLPSSLRTKIIDMSLQNFDFKNQCFEEFPCIRFRSRSNDTFVFLKSEGRFSREYLFS